MAGRILRALVCAMSLALVVRDASAARSRRGTGGGTGGGTGADGLAKVEVRGVRVVGDAYGDDMQGLRAFNWSKGTTVALLVTLGAGGIVDFDGEASKLDKMTDDKGADLLEGEGFGQSGFGMMPSVSKDGKACMLELTGKSVPGKGARDIQASGTIVIKSAANKKTDRQQDVALKKGAKLTAGPVPFTISKVGKPDWGDEPLEIMLSAREDLSAVAGFRFLDAAGKEIKSSDGGTMSMRAMGTVSIDKSFRLARKVDRLTVEVTYWTDMKTVRVPFSVKASVGL